MGFYYEPVFRENGRIFAPGLMQWMRNEAGWKVHKMFLRRKKAGEEKGITQFMREGVLTFTGSLLPVMRFSHTFLPCNKTGTSPARHLFPMQSSDIRYFNTINMILLRDRRDET